jgi:hypothetical protein
MKNSELLAKNRSTLTGLDRQRHFVLSTLIQKNPCPICATVQNFFEGSGIALDDWADKAGGTPCRCIACGSGLIYVVPFLALTGNGGWLWSLEPLTAPPAQGGTP